MGLRDKMVTIWSYFLLAMILLFGLIFDGTCLEVMPCSADWVWPDRTWKYLRKQWRRALLMHTWMNYEVIMSGCPAAFIWPNMLPTEQLLDSVAFDSDAFILLEGIIFRRCVCIFATTYNWDVWGQAQSIFEIFSFLFLP